MILPFKQKFPWGAQTYFREKILAVAAIPCPIDGSGDYKRDKVSEVKMFPKKIHTIRAGSRWKPGMKLHMAYGVRTKNYQQFNKGIPELDVVKSVQSIRIWRTGEFSDRTKKTEDIKVRVHIMIDGKLLYDVEDHKILAQNDGFDSLEDFYRWFDKDFEGQIIHWTDFKY